MAPDLLLIRDQEAYQGFDQQMRQPCLRLADLVASASLHLARLHLLARALSSRVLCTNSHATSLADTGHDVSVSGGSDGGIPVTMPLQPWLAFSAAPLLHSAVGDATAPLQAQL